MMSMMRWEIKVFVKDRLFRLGHQIHVFDVSGNESV